VTPGGAWFRLYRTPYAGTAQHTIAGWEVKDLEAEVAELKARGVAFQEYRSAQLQTVDGIATTQGGRATWFRHSSTTSQWRWRPQPSPHRLAAVGGRVARPIAGSPSVRMVEGELGQSSAIQRAMRARRARWRGALGVAGGSAGGGAAASRRGQDGR
jgi:hypothetical protein